jgi:hypothetical protein
LKVNKLALNYSFILLNIKVNSFPYSMQLEFLTIILVSSEKRIGIDLLFIIIGRPLIYSKKK